jgi:hypothetical protein
VALRSARAKEESSRCIASSSGEAEVTSGSAVPVMQPMWHGAGLGLRDFFLCLVWLKASEPASSNDTTAKAAAQRLHRRTLVLTHGTGVGIFAEGVGVSFGENFHQPAIKVIHWVVHDGLKTPVVLSMSFFNVIT